MIKLRRLFVLFVLLLLTGLIIFEYAELYTRETNSAYSKLLVQVRLCGSEIQNTFYDFKEESNYLCSNIKTATPFTEINKTEIISLLGRFYSKHQYLLDSIVIKTQNNVYSLHKTDVNYFNFTDIKYELTPGTVYNDKNSANTHIIKNSLSDNTGKKFATLYFHVNLPQMINTIFYNYYLGKRSWHFFIDTKSNVQSVYYSERSVNPDSIYFNELDKITNKIAQGFEGKLASSLVLENNDKVALVSAYYPLTFDKGKYGIIFSINTDEYMGWLKVSTFKIFFYFLAIIAIVVLIFGYLFYNVRKANTELVESKEKLKHALDSFPDLIALHNNNGIVMEVFGNSNTSSLFPKLNLRKPITENISLQDRINLSGYFNESVNKKKLTVFEYLDEEYDQYYEVRTAPIYNNLNLCIFRNITDRVKAEQENRLSHERFVKVLNSIDALIYVSDFDSYEILFINEYTKKVFGEIEGRLCYEAIQSGQQEPCRFCNNNKLISNLNKSNEKIVWEFQNTNNNRWYEVHDRAIPWTNGKMVRMEIAYDITERKGVLNKLKQSEEEFRRIFDSFIDLYFRTRLDGVIELVSPSIMSIAGFTPDEVLGKNVNTLYKIPSQRKQMLKELLANGYVQDFEVRLSTKDDEIKDVSVNARLVKNIKNEPIGIEGSLRDITERKTAENKLKSAMVAAEEADKTKSRFLASMSHELRTPLNGILGYAQILMGDDKLNHKTMEGLNVIHRSGEHLLNLINEILDISKIEADKLELGNERFSLTKLFSDIKSIFELKAHNKGINLVFNLAPNLPSCVVADEKRLKQVLINLLNNAVKFTNEGTITLTVVRTGEKTLYFEVKDTGVGMKKNDLEIIFTPFTQLADTKAKADGTGLGLAISSRLVNLFGGKLEVESSPNIGSKFYFEITFDEIFCEEISNIEEKEDDSIQEEFKGYSVLIVDDNYYNRLVLSRMLEKYGIKIFEASDGVEAVKLATEFTPDLILMDMYMPELDGLEASKQINEKIETNIILVSATQTNSDIDFEKYGVKDFILKPVKKSDLLNKIKPYFSKDLFTQDKPVVELEEEIPDINDLNELITYINNRNYSKIHKKLDNILKDNPQYEPFVNEMKSLAGSFSINGLKEKIKVAIKNTATKKHD